MCRWLAYSGSPVLLEELLYKPQHSLIDQSLHSQARRRDDERRRLRDRLVRRRARRRASSTASSRPGTTANLRELAAHIRSPLVFAHIRASTGTPVQQTNCHPFRHGRWLWMHNGADPRLPRASSASSCSPSTRRCIREIEGSTDSEVFFFLALTLGLEDDPPARRRARGRAHRGGRPPARRRASDPDDGRDDRRASDLGVPLLERGQVALALLLDATSTRCATQHPDNPVLHELSDESRLVVSEPLGDLAGAWNEVPESSYGVIQEGQDELRPFSLSPPPEVLDARSQGGNSAGRQLAPPSGSKRGLAAPGREGIERSS